ncbi:PREDICTED: protein NRT1/ PTR FAMILY 1.2-like isoform X2 [Ipomoea nil]|uniref:protein NRT1/ PTR FAMILY 1.2-like isoform X2 n=1 Tax=Ipomoea nil TaxID=35883 RepID=UPI0009015BE6|nr:PREDICTED: protein NRT1/ PTR FAMILY 1.2-like isoform X2 [Ipomoea nil]
MENFSDEKGEQQPLLETSAPQPQGGGLRTLPFIAGNLALTIMVTSGLAPNMILYLMREYQMDMASGSNVLYWWSASSNITPVIGAFMADSFVGRFQIITMGSVISLVGIFLFWLTTVIPQARPPPCLVSNNNTCSSATALQLFLLFTSFILVSIGSGGVKSSSLAFGVDQLKNEGVKMERYFGWYYAITLVSGLVAMTCLVYIQENMGWEIGFGVLLLLMLFAAVLIFLGSPFYVKPKPKGSLITGLIQVIVASYRKRSIVLSFANGGGIAYHQEGTMLRLPSETLRFLNKACIIQDPHQDLNSDGKAADPWSLCTVDQVEELKAILKVIPIWVTGVIMSINISQGSFDTLQATTVDRHIIGSSFEIPVGSLGIFAFVSIVIWLVSYERAIIPIASRIMGKPARFSTKTRMGCGIFVSFLSVVVAAIVETVRRSLANKEGYSEDPDGIIEMSVLWLVPHLLLVGIAEAINAVAQNEFFVSEFPQSMASIASNLLGLGFAAGSVAASFLMSAINDMTEGGESGSWISSNINKGHYDYYNWILAGLSMANMLLFFFCSRAYGPCREENDLNAVVEVEGES